MAWSTRELAELAGTTVNTVRHYHSLGLLDEPDRRANGYKQYGVAHLVRLLRIRRLVQLGVPLAKLADVAHGGEDTTDALRAIDAELTAGIARLERARDEVRAVLRERSPADAPAGFESVAARLSDADSSIIHILGRLYDDRAMADLRAMVENDDDPANAELDRLPADADEATRQGLAERLAPTLTRELLQYPWLLEPEPHLATTAAVAQQTFVQAAAELYNGAQLDVLARAGTIATDAVTRARAQAAETDSSGPAGAANSADA